MAAWLADALVWVIVLAAAYYAGRRIWRQLMRLRAAAPAAGCSSCDNCDGCSMAAPRRAATTRKR